MKFLMIVFFLINFLSVFSSCTAQKKSSKSSGSSCNGVNFNHKKFINVKHYVKELTRIFEGLVLRGNVEKIILFIEIRFVDFVPTQTLEMSLNFIEDYNLLKRIENIINDRK